MEKFWWSWEDTGRVCLLRKSFPVQSRLPRGGASASVVCGRLACHVCTLSLGD